VDSAPTYSADVSLPSGWTITVGDVAAVDGAGAATPCPASDTGLQRITITVTTPTEYASSTDVIKRDKA
jgi:hypothetical protein